MLTKVVLFQKQMPSSGCSVWFCRPVHSQHTATIRRQWLQCVVTAQAYKIIMAHNWPPIFQMWHF